ncbi:glycerate kinase-like isoform X2 [Ostrea edulis]|uniref:glycerate kinase-like isoform X2 n=1 Tax=Ostrea edulis TaxID=37623 RepID=UPI002095464B|nr:glycerate kinase-like isoform X2 [Ostrea edulis]XP_055999105.1 glycerate kinase-like isoform X2 [Ostrea edulis]
MWIKQGCRVPFQCTRRTWSRLISTLKSSHAFRPVLTQHGCIRRTGAVLYNHTMSSEQHQEIRDIFNTAVSSVLPSEMIGRALTFDNNCLHVGGREYTLDNNVYVVGFGKAVAGMARAVEDQLQDHIIDGILSVPYGLGKSLKELGKMDLWLKEKTRLKVMEGAKGNLPDSDAQVAALAIKDLVTKLTDRHILIVLISGGGSSLLPLPCPPITLEEEVTLTKMMSQNGATINDLNTIRKHIEQLKGGGLAKAAHPAQVISLILSDVVGDKMDIIASAPTVFDVSSPQMCIDIFKELKVQKQVPASISEYLFKKSVEFAKMPSLRKPEVGYTTPWSKFQHVKNVIVGNNTMATQAAKTRADELGLLSFVMSVSLEGEARRVGELYVDIAQYIALVYNYKPSYDGGCISLVQLELKLTQFGFEKKTLNELNSLSRKARNSRKGVCVIGGGETVVKVKGQGKGGRNQEMVLAFGISLENARAQEEKLNIFSIEFMSGGTDGQDGPTDAAGAIADESLMQKCAQEGLEAANFLENNDSYTLFTDLCDGAYIVKTGLTGTNVMDIQTLIVRPKVLEDH